MHFCDKLQDFAAAQIVIKNGIVGQITDLALDGGTIAVAIEAIDQYPARAGHQDTHHHADGGGLASPIRAQEAEYFSLADLQTERLECLETTVLLGQTFEGDHLASWKNIGVA